MNSGFWQFVIRWGIPLHCLYSDPIEVSLCVETNVFRNTSACVVTVCAFAIDCRSFASVVL
jgi:hypothetical protein